MSDVPEVARIRMLIDSLPGHAVVLWNRPAPDDSGIVFEASTMTNAEAVGFVAMAQAAMIKRILEAG